MKTADRLGNAAREAVEVGLWVGKGIINAVVAVVVCNLAVMGAKLLFLIPLGIAALFVGLVRVLTSCP